MGVKLIGNEFRKYLYEKKIYIFLGVNTIITTIMYIITAFYSQTKPQSGLDFAFSALNGLGMLILIFSIIYAGEILPREFSQGTIKQLMIKPHSRTKILFSKYVTVFLLAAVQYLAVFIVALTLGTASFGFYDNGTQLSSLISTFANGTILPLVFLVTIAFMLSVITKSSAIAISFGIGLQTIGQLIGSLIQSKIQWFSKFYLFSIMDFSNLPAHATKTSSTIALITYFIIFILITFTYFNKKDIE